MELKTIKLSEIKFSRTNTRPESDFKGADFSDLVASVKAKGVLTPVLVRKVNGAYELIAGERRLRAAAVAELKEIPANVVVMNDTEAREAQIIENLQRKDIHPIDEAIAYKDLIESSKPKIDVAGVAAKVGKSESYVRQRLVLASLDKKISEKARSGELPIGHAVLIARLEKEGQASAFKYALQRGDVCDLKDLREHIAQQVFHAAMKSPPWKDNAAAKAEIAKITGLKGGEKNLFGEDAVEKIENPADYARALAAYISLVIDERKAAGKPITLISREYNTKAKGVLGRNQYSLKEHAYYGKCKLSRDGLIVEGEGAGKVMQICTDKKCPGHNSRAAEETPAAKAKAKTQRKKEITAEKNRQAKHDREITALAKDVKWPPVASFATGLLELAFQTTGGDTERKVANKLEVEPVRGKRSWGAPFNDFAAALRTHGESLDDQGKVQLAFEIWFEGMYAADGRRAKVHALVSGKTKKK